MPTDLDIEREFADLVEILREDRAEIRPHFASQLDSKVAAGFPREPWWRRYIVDTRAFAPVIAVSMVALLVAGLASLPRGGDDEGAGGSDSGGGGEVAYQAAPQVAEDADESGGAGRDQLKQSRRSRAKQESATASPPGGGGGSPRTDNRQGRRVETSASLVLGAKPGGVQGVADEVVSVTDRHRGFVLTSNVQTTDGGGGAHFQLRVPSDRLKATLADLSKIADVRERREATEDITREFVSARSRLADARADRKGLLRRLARALTEAERESIKFQLRDVGARIAAAKTDLARVNNRASYSNISVDVVGDPSAGAAGEDGGSWTPGDAAKDALRVLEVAVGVLLIALAVGLPIALLAALALLAARLMRRRRHERLLDAV